MKRILLLAGIIVLCLALTACAGADKPTAETSGEIAFDFDVLTTELGALMYTDSNGQQQSLFGEINVLDDKAVNAYMQIDTTNFEECFCARHSDETHASLVMVIKPIDGAEDSVKSQMHTFLDMYAAQYSSYFPPAVKMIEDYYTIDKGDYIIYTISDDNQAVIGAINRSKK